MQGMSHAEIVYRVAHGDLRPTFSPTVPQLLVDIACACWVTDPTLRPTAASVLKSLEDLLEGGPLIMPSTPRGSMSTEEQCSTSSDFRIHMASLRVPPVIEEESSVV